MSEEKIYTIQKTSKRWKIIFLAAMGCAVLGLICHANGASETGTFLLGMALVWWCVYKIGKWWNHG